MFPNIDAEQRVLALADRRVLVGRGFNLQLFAVEQQPGPAAAENFCGGFCQLVFKPGKAAKAFING